MTILGSCKKSTSSLSCGSSLTASLTNSCGSGCRILKYEPGMVVAEGDYVMIHGRYMRKLHRKFRLSLPIVKKRL
jgi:hypothetical protein